MLPQDAPDGLGVDLLPDVGDGAGDSGDAPGRGVGHGADQHLDPGRHLGSSDRVGELRGRLLDQLVPALEGPHVGHGGERLEFAPADGFAQDAEGAPPRRGEGELGALGDAFPVVSVRRASWHRPGSERGAAAQ